MVRASSEELARAVAAHAARRLTALGMRAIRIRAQSSTPLWHQVSARLGVSDLDGNAHRCAQRILSSGLGQPLAVIAALPRAGTWDRLVASELATLRMASREAAGVMPPLLIFTTNETDLAADLAAETFDIAPTLGEEEKSRWFEALLDEATQVFDSDELSKLESHWQSVKAAPQERAGNCAAHPPETRDFFEALSLAKCAWPKSEIAALSGDRNTLKALVRLGVVEVEHGWVAIGHAGEAAAKEAAAAASEAACLKVANALVKQWPADPWAQARAAELQLIAKDVDVADKAHADALARLPDALARRDVIAR